ncbi:isochorismatase family protein [Pseudalkalibacillus caeni]|uniref:Isochorismatase family protein n=1 Tax=Exobacillus caeni TaxID=2574798 RepID=A0A5R9F1E9_9BACL|nr:isochorismatase family protein [Pseudalkalibacillus caeni]TLS36250.1 isochorismatase family protein [Pseudalkalibacillus caeni]
MKESFEGFGENIQPGERPAVVVVDFIKGFTDPQCKLGSNLDEEVNNTKKLLDAARSKKLPIIFTTVVYEPHFLDGGYFIEKVPALKNLTAESEWIKVDERLERRDDSEPLITKKYASSFFGTSLSSILAYHRVDTLIVTGCTTSGCVRATVVDALQYGFKPIVPEECVGDRSEQAHRANLNDIQTKYGEVIGIDYLLDFLKAL